MKEEIILFGNRYRVPTNSGYIQIADGTMKRLTETMINGDKVTIASFAKCYDILHDDIRVYC